MFQSIACSTSSSSFISRRIGTPAGQWHAPLSHFQGAWHPQCCRVERRFTVTCTHPAAALRTILLQPGPTAPLAPPTSGTGQEGRMQQAAANEF